ncbi:MAG: hypothetical protein QF858_01860 [Candidatus Pacebacteria bacterium]|jgi:hypothetical protein|nr:hypothetical protein [Candidatus Paceibacterota bacterium]|tara:strand:+ start:5357 stop:5563 length:207 start_codon:yes stop_codon:yes gene_type:complete
MVGRYSTSSAGEIRRLAGDHPEWLEELQKYIRGEIGALRDEISRWCVLKNFYVDRKTDSSHQTTKQGF